MPRGSRFCGAADGNITLRDGSGKWETGIASYIFVIPFSENMLLLKCQDYTALSLYPDFIEEIALRRDSL